MKELKKEEITQLLLQSGKLIHQTYDKNLKQIQLTYSQAKLISFLEPHKEYTYKEIMRLLNLSKATISELLKQLEKKSLLERYTNNFDQRKNVIVLTKKGEEIKIELMNILFQTEKDFFVCLHQEDIDQLYNILKTIYNNLKKRE